jgi:SAM-dependent methyltransferase
LLPSLAGYLIRDMRALREVYRGQAAAGGSEHWSGPPGMVDRIAAALGTRPDHLILDVGAGVGGPARRLLAVVGCRVVAVELLPEVAAAGARRAAAGERLAYVAGSAMAVPIRSGAVDQVWSLGVVAHVRDVDGFCAEACRVLRADGTVALTEALWDGRREPRFSRSAPTPWRPLTVDQLVIALLGAGFGSVRELPWPGHGLPDSAPPSDPALAADIEDGRLRPRLLVATRP